MGISEVKMLINEKGNSFWSTAEKELIKDVKQECCFIQKDPSLNDNKIAESVIRELPDGSKMTLAKERCRCSEILFQAQKY